MHSSFSIFARFTIAFTSRLIGQVREQVRQSEHLSGAACKRRLGHASRLRSQRPRIMKGAIQQTVWQPASRPKITARPRNRTMMM